MREREDTLTQLVTRIPVALRRRVKIHCVQIESTLTEFVINAIEERLGREESRRPAR